MYSGLLLLLLLLPGLLFHHPEFSPAANLGPVAAELFEMPLTVIVANAVQFAHLCFVQFGLCDLSPREIPVGGSHDLIFPAPALLILWKTFLPIAILTHSLVPSLSFILFFFSSLALLVGKFWHCNFKLVIRGTAVTI